MASDSYHRCLQLHHSTDGETGRLFLEGKIYSCKSCRTHLALCEDVLSKFFHGKNGKAYLVNNVVNVTVGEADDKLLMTGMHSVADISCVSCETIVGWKYEAAYEKSQKFKEGKYVLESCKISNSDGVTHEARVGGSEATDS